MEELAETSGDSLENACRLCLSTEQSRSSIFELADANVPFAEKIRLCLSIQVKSDDKLSTLVCDTCIKNINHWHSYKDTCLKAQEKLQQWINKKNGIQPLVTVKKEPLDKAHADSSEQVKRTESAIGNHVEADQSKSDDVAQSSAVRTPSRLAAALAEQHSKINESMDVFSPEIQIKTEPMDTDDEYDCSLDMDSVNSGELLINPMAVAAGNTAGSERIMEADSTQRFKTRRFPTKKVKRRGPHTHFRGLRLFKKRCDQCLIYLHSKYSYSQHMSRFHGIVNNSEYDDEMPQLQQQPASPSKQKSKLTEHVDNSEPVADTENETINPEDAEFVKMIKTDPLTPVQKTIIGQLKTFSCYACKQTFFDRRHTLNHIRQHMPDLKPYTCIACLTEFSDRSMYKLHCGASFECAMKIALVVPKIGHEKYFTCNMCLKAFNNRRELLTHLAMHSDKQHMQLSQPIRSPGKLNSPSSTVAGAAASSQSSTSKRDLPAGPYMGGDPNHNHMCDLCGMIYRYKPNMIKHRELCNTLQDDIRTSYRCFYCSMTYLVYKKFYTHVYYEHKKREIICFTCHEKLPTADDYLIHHETHRVYPKKDSKAEQPKEDAMDQLEANSLADPLNSSNHPTEGGEKPFNCALCGENFATKLELSEHRNLHLKVKIYSCVVCRSMFSSSGALEQHMKVHGFDDASKQAANSSAVEYGRGGNSSLNESAMSAASDPGGGIHHCYVCGKNFSTYTNLKRHERNLHVNQRRRWSCDYCKRRFKTSEDHDEHIRVAHGGQVPKAAPIMTALPAPQLSSPTGKPLLQCPKCPKTFTYQGNLIQHCQNVHNETHFEHVIRQSAPPAPAAAAAAPPPRPRGMGYSCDTCGKTFKEEQSLKTHKGWHLRTNYRLKSDQNLSMDDNLLSGQGYKVANQPKPAKARKSFPNHPSQQQMNNVSGGGSLQCQVCDDRFGDVTALRNHLWDVHCARNKPEKSFTGELQCELCTTKFSDEASLREHMEWHSQNPILGNHANSEMRSASGAPVATFVVNRKMFRCETCGKNYSNRKMYLRHKKLHKIVPAATMMNLQSLHKSRSSRYCHACQKNFATDASLRRHKASPCHLNVVRSQMQAPAKKITTTAIVHQPPSEFVHVPSVKEEPGSDYSGSSSNAPGQSHQQIKKKPVTCSVCKTIFPNMSVLYQHKQLVHKQMPLSSIHQEKSYAGQQPQQAKKFAPVTSAEGLVSCNVCGKKFPGLANLKLHFSHKHKPKPITFPCSSPGCKLVFSSNSSLKNHENTHTSIIYNCQLCDRHVFSKVAMTKHMLSMHKAVYQQSGSDKSNLWTETDLTNYSVKNCQSTACPKCKVKYPNLKALKIHYLKFHDKT